MSKLTFSYKTPSIFQLAIPLLWTLNVVSATPGLNIDNDPAPPPEKGPPLSASASRDKRLLPYQITGILGAYLVFTATLLTLLLVVGRRFRRSALAGRTLAKIEMVKPNTDASAFGVQDITPVSPTKQHWESPTDSETTYLYPSPVSPTTGAPRSWVKPSGASHRTQPSQTGSVLTFDERVLESDKARAQSEMDRLYAAVAAHEERKHEVTRSQTSGNGLPTSPKAQFQTSTSSVSSPRQQSFPKEVYSPRQAQFASPLASPQFSQFQYQPPMSPSALSHPMAPTPVTNPLSPPLSPREAPPFRLSKVNPLSFFSSRSRNNPDKSNSLTSIKGLPISNPLTSPRLKNSVGMTGDGPMSPRAYAPGHPPPTPGFPKPEVSVMPTIPQSSEPSPQPQLARPTATSKRAAPAPLTLGTEFVPPAAATSQLPQQKGFGGLPLRDYGPTPPQSAPYTRLQFADRRESRINPGPKTGTPYPHSPYMPFSPVTPLSATLKTGKDLKIAKKMARMEEKEMVQSEEDIWGG